MKSFASDNYAGVLPELMEALAACNSEHAPSYGNDEYTSKAVAAFEKAFGRPVSAHFVFNGTGANVFSVACANASFQAVLCADVAHIYNDESSAPETFTGCRYFPLPTDENGKLLPQTVAERLIRKGDLHYPQINMLSLTQTTEYGTVYSLDELKAFGDLCKKHALIFHIDGSRLFNAAVHLNCSLRDISDCGVDILSLGGTKNGLMFGEAVIIFKEELRSQARFRHKQSMQLASKTRFIAAQFSRLLQDDFWRKPALHANKHAAYLAEKLSAFPQVRITRPVQANAIFACIPPTWNAPLTEIFPFYVWRDDINEVRLMCAWDTCTTEIDRLIAAMASL